MSEHAMQLEAQYGAKNYSPLPVVLTNGEGVWVEDVHGHRYMDMLSSYSALNQGHRHPKVI
ncbi:aminotransferase class III-fold pyridoxal phosphate-dependent enzyme, partial [Alicyclobacillaceae bacterium I2511]